MLNLLSATVVLPLLGAGGVLLAAFLLAKLDVGRPRIYALLVALALASATFILVCALRLGRDAPGMLSSASPLILAQSVVRFQAHPTLWALAAVSSLAFSSLLLAELGRQPGISLPFTPIPLLLLALTLGALWSANPLTMIVLWAFYDLAYLLAQIVVDGGSGVCGRSMAVSTVATVLLWTGVLVAGDGTGVVQWSLIPGGGAKMTVWMVAGLLRIGVYPFHFATPSRVERTSPLAGVLLLSPVIGWGLLARLALINDGALPVANWLTIVATATVVGGAILAWTARSARDTGPWLGTAVTGAVLLASNLMSQTGPGPGAGAGRSLSGLTWGATTWILVMTLFLLAGGLVPPPSWRRWEIPYVVPALIAALWTISLPLTLGISGYLRALAPRSWGFTAGLFVGQLFLAAAVGRWLFPAGGSADGDMSRLRWVSAGAALLVPGLALIGVGLAPDLLSPYAPGISPLVMVREAGPIGWLLWAGAVGLGTALGWYDRHIRSTLSSWVDGLHDLLLLDWGYRLSAGAVDQGFAVVRTIDDILAGRGALLWSFVLFLSLILLLRLR